MLTTTNFQTGDTIMNLTRLAAITVIALGFVTSAHAQGADRPAHPTSSAPTVRFDPLDPVSRVAILASRASRGTVAMPTALPGSVTHVTPAAIPAISPQAVRNLVRETSDGPSRFYSALNGISAGLQVSHEALGVYEHATKANALRNYYNER
jgi:hypothetical protein